jgi:biopolymer transport protein ExbD
MANAPPSVEFLVDTDEQPIALDPRRADEVEMDITPMIDITFLLLIFFLVATRMSAEAYVDLPKARHGTAVTTKDAVVLTVARGGDDQARIYTSDGAIPAAELAAGDLAAQEKQIIQYVQTGLGEPGKHHVLIKAERGVKHREVARVAKAVGQAAETELYVAVLEER